MPRKTQSAKAAYSGGAKPKTARKPKAKGDWIKITGDTPPDKIIAQIKAKAPAKPARKPASAKKAKPVAIACTDGIEAPAVKHAGGRPTKYDPAYCEKAVGFGKQGKSVEWIACEFEVHVDTIYEWAKVHPAFSDAITLAKQYEQRWWEDTGQEHLTTTGFSASAWSRSMAARFPKKWREKTQVDHGVTSEFAALLGDLDGHGASII